MRVAVTDRDPARVAGDVVVWVFRPGDPDVPFPFVRHLSRRALGLVQIEEHALTWLEATRMLAPRALMASLGGNRPEPGLGGTCGDKTAEEIVVRDRHDLRTLGAAIERACNAAGAKRLVLVVEPGGGEVELLVEGMLLRAYQCNEWRDREATTSVRQVTVCVSKRDKRDAKFRVRRAETIARATNLTRELGDLPSNIGTPLGIVERVRPHAEAAGLAMRVMSMGEAREHGLGLFCGVAGGSVNPGCILELEHEHDPGAAEPPPLLILIGKGVTHDIGGYNIKTGPNLHAMTYDKCGGMAVIGAMMAIANLQLPLRVIAIVPLADNAIDGHPFKPGDILTAMDTTTVFIENTDAEGRLVLADALCWADHYEPDAVIDLATLTGASGMGDPFGALFSNSDQLRDLLLASGRSTDDLLWPMPIHEQHERELGHFKADVRNGGPGGASMAAAFLRYFVEFPWAHVDIVGKEFWEFPRDYRGEGATGFGCRLLIEAATRYAAAHGDPSREVRDGT